MARPGGRRVADGPPPPVSIRNPHCDECFHARPSENSEPLYESDNGVLGGPHRSAAGGRSGAPETEMAQRRIDFLSLTYKKSSDPGNSPTASRESERPEIAPLAIEYVALQ